MEGKKGFGETLNTFFAGKGFYIVLLLCAGLIATSIWLMASGSGADVEASGGKETAVTQQAAVGPEENSSVPTMSETEREPVRREDSSVPVMETEETTLTGSSGEEIRPVAPEVHMEPASGPETAEPESAAAASVTAGYFIWPVNGAVEREYSGDKLTYDRTMADWRTHSGVDLAADQGSQVLAVNNGTVSAVYEDEMLGSVVEVDHGDGLVSVYANLQPGPAVQTGQRVSVGDVLGTVGATALGESAQESHLHFAMRYMDQTADPAQWLPER